MFHVKISFYGQGNRPRTIRGYKTREGAEDHAYYLMHRYEHSDGDRRIKSVVVKDQHGFEQSAWYYTNSYHPRLGSYHTH